MEHWRPVAGFDGRYEVSDLGNVRGLDRYVETRSGRRRFVRGQLLSPILSGRGDYLTVSLKVDGKQHGRYIHRIVAEAFFGPAPDGMECRHLNGDGHDNRVANLAWGTHSENVQDTLAHGRHNKASTTRCPHGHPYDEANTYVWINPKTGGRARMCRTCIRARSAA